MFISIIKGSEMLKMLNYSSKKITNDNYFVMIGSGEVTQFYKCINDFPTSLSDAVYVVLKNADFTEGNGPMIYNAVFKNYDDAVAYIMGQKGICGSLQEVKNYPGINMEGNPFCVSSFNGFKIIVTILK